MKATVGPLAESKGDEAGSRPFAKQKSCDQISPYDPPKCENILAVCRFARVRDLKATVRLQVSPISRRPVTLVENKGEEAGLHKIFKENLCVTKSLLMTHPDA